MLFRSTDSTVTTSSFHWTSKSAGVTYSVDTIRGVDYNKLKKDFEKNILTIKAKYLFYKHPLKSSNANTNAGTVADTQFVKFVNVNCNYDTKTQKQYGLSDQQMKNLIVISVLSSLNNSNNNSQNIVNKIHNVGLKKNISNLTTNASFNLVSANLSNGFAEIKLSQRIK